MSIGERRQDMLDIGIKVGVLENNNDLLTRIVTKMEGTLEKTQEIAVNLVKIVAVHEERVNNQEKNLDYHKKEDTTQFDKLVDMVENTKRDLSVQIAEVKAELEPLKKFFWQAMGVIAVVLVLIEVAGLLLK